MTRAFYASIQTVTEPGPTRRICDSYLMLWALVRQHVRPYRRLLAIVAAYVVATEAAKLWFFRRLVRKAASGPRRRKAVRYAR